MYEIHLQGGVGTSGVPNLVKSKSQERDIYCEFMRGVGSKIKRKRGIKESGRETNAEVVL